MTLTDAPLPPVPALPMPPPPPMTESVTQHPAVYAVGQTYVLASASAPTARVSAARATNDAAGDGESVGAMLGVVLAHVEADREGPLLPAELTRAVVDGSCVPSMEATGVPLSKPLTDADTDAVEHADDDREGLAIVLREGDTETEMDARELLLSDTAGVYE